MELPKPELLGVSMGVLFLAGCVKAWREYMTQREAFLDAQSESIRLEINRFLMSDYDGTLATD